MITRPLLAGKIPDISKLRYPLLATPKLDGIRILKVNGKILTRTFKPLPNNYTRTKLEKILPDGIDGELMLADSEATYNEIQSAFMTIEGEPRFKYHAFDYVKGKLTQTYFWRVTSLEEWYHDIGSKYTCIGVLNNLWLKGEEELLYFEKLFLEAGYEGVMLRSPDSPYKCGRSTFNEHILLKLKRFEDAEAKIVGFVQKMKNTNAKEKDNFGNTKRSHKKAGKVAADTLGALVVEDLKTKVEFEIGTGIGLDDKLKKLIWDNPDNYVGKIVKYRYQEIGTKDKPRCPSFQGFRSKLDI